MSGDDWTAMVQERLRHFAHERDWEQYHTLRNLAALIATEAGELLALYRWDEDALSERRQQVENELADVLLGVLRFADIADIDLESAARHKLELNAAKYPAGKNGPEPPDEQSEVVCGVDAGTFRSLSYVAWLRGNIFHLTSYRASATEPLPAAPLGWRAPRVIALDLPQSLPAPGQKRRRADAGAGTPTSVLPASRQELNEWKLYRGLIEAGVDSFWCIHNEARGRIGGLTSGVASDPLVVETYPRYVIKRLWQGYQIPSKRKEPGRYVAEVWSLIQERGLSCTSVPTTPDHVDAMLCAIAARACLEHDGLPPGTVGTAPFVDAADNLLREGFIVAP